MTPTPPNLSFVATISVQVGVPIEVGQTPEGGRRIIPINGGTVNGPRLKGAVLSAGADFQLLRTSTLTELEAKYAIETEDGKRIYVTNFGLRSGSADDIAALVNGEDVDPERIYFRCNPRFSTNAAEWAWLNSKIFIGSGERRPKEVRLQIFAVE